MADRDIASAYQKGVGMKEHTEEGVALVVDTWEEGTKLVFAGRREVGMWDLASAVDGEFTEERAFDAHRDKAKLWHSAGDDKPVYRPVRVRVTIAIELASDAEVEAWWATVIHKADAQPGD